MADPLEKPTLLIESANALAQLGMRDSREVNKVQRAVVLFEDAQALLQAQAKRDLPEGLRVRVTEMLALVKRRIGVCKVFLETPAAQRELPQPEAGDAKPPAQPEAPQPPPLPPFEPGQRARPWVRAVVKRYDETPDPAIRAAIAEALEQKAGVHALRALFKLFESEAHPAAREGVHKALAAFGTNRVANQMASYATDAHEDHWRHALDVIYRCLAKPERLEPERPFQKAIRAFHKMKKRRVSLRVVSHLDRMGKEGVAALGEIVYVKDFGYHDHVIDLLSTKRDRRAVPPLVYKMNRFKFDARVQIPAHKALLKLGWYAVPELVDRLDDKAAGIWISWTLRKISGETMGTDKRKWHDWWKSEKVRHPELFDDPDERPETTPRD